MSKPIIFFDIEATGPDPVNDRIISLAMMKSNSIHDAINDSMNQLVNPGRPIPEESIAIHGITNEMVKESGLFSTIAPSVYEFISECDMAGFGVNMFDVPILWEELYRCGIEWDLTGVNVIDAGVIFKKKEERNLAAAVRFYCGWDLNNAHNAEADTMASKNVLVAQIMRYPDLGQMSVQELSAFSKFDPHFDLAGKIIIDKDGDPAYGFGRNRGDKVRDNPGLAEWMMSRDFPTQTKMVLRKYLEDIREGQMEFDHEDNDLPFLP